MTVFVPRRPRDIFSRRYRHRIGYEGEYYLIRKLNDLKKPGYCAVRTPGSGTGKLSLKPDVLAVDNGELCAIEVKSTNKKEVYIPREQLERLLAFTELFVVRCPSCGQEIRPKPMIAVRFLGRGWVVKDVSEVREGMTVRSEEVGYEGG
jgi:Holliday junction resolvase